VQEINSYLDFNQGDISGKGIHGFIGADLGRP
jgi:hypothetical protein